MSPKKDKAESQTLGGLWVVGTPIGNLGDLSLRAKEILSQADFVACEDKRVCGRLFQLLGLKPPQLLLVNEHTEEKMIPKILDYIEQAKSVVLTSDAGMPTLSDPGRRLVGAVLDMGLVLSTAPGPTAVTTALALSGLDANRYVFEGFLPKRSNARSSRMSGLAEEARTLVLYESPHRINACLKDLAQHFGETRKVLVAGELTKLHETLWRGSLGDAAKADLTQKGEYVIVVQGMAEASVEGDRSKMKRLKSLDMESPEMQLSDSELSEIDLPEMQKIKEALSRELSSGLSSKDAAVKVSKQLGLSKKLVYDIASQVKVQLQHQSEPQL